MVGPPLSSLVESAHRLPSRAVKPNFTGPSYTLGIEEELMIVDARDARTSSTRSRTCSRTPQGAKGEIKPELLESVLEIATKPCQDTREAGAELRGLRRQVAEIGRPPRPRDRLGRHAPVRDLGGPADLRPPALPRPHRRAALRRAPGDHLRPARARRHRRRRQGDPRRQRHARARAACCSRCRPTRRSGAARRPAWPRRGCRSSASSRASACRPPTTTGTTTTSGSASWSSRADRGLHLPLVRRPPAPELRHGRDPRDGRADARRAHARRWRR